MKEHSERGKDTNRRKIQRGWGEEEVKEEEEQEEERLKRATCVLRY